MLAPVTLLSQAMCLEKEGLRRTDSKHWYADATQKQHRHRHTHSCTKFCPQRAVRCEISAETSCNLALQVDLVGKRRLVLDLSCRQRDGQYWVVTDRWQRFSQLALSEVRLHVSLVVSQPAQTCHHSTSLSHAKRLYAMIHTRGNMHNTALT